MAEPLAKPAGKPILVISGNISNTNVGDTAQFDRDMLEAIGLVTVETTNPWYDGRVRFEGVSMDKLMSLVGAKGTKVTAVALNDYVSSLPLEDFKRFNVILAMKRDGNYMPVRDKGPLFIIYPYDSDPQLQTQTYYTRSAWQVAKLIVE
ncbi:oxidoreductase [Ochrobactrum intermedium]|nr:oxidoreductase [Ochrobactrum sp. MC-1LL]